MSWPWRAWSSRNFTAARTSTSSSHWWWSSPSCLARSTSFNEDRIVRYLKEACLLLIWLSSLVIAITTTARQIPAERESRTIYPLLAKPVGRGEFIAGQIRRVLAGLRLVPGGLLFLFRPHHRLARTCLAVGPLLSGHLVALDLPGHCHRHGLARIGRLHRPFFQRHHFFYCRGGHSLCRRPSQWHRH